MRPRIYISGPLTGGHKLTHHDIQLNLALSVRVYKRLTDLGFACHLPHLTMYLEWLHGLMLPYETWMEIDRSLIHGFDAVYRFGQSKGADIERVEANDYGVPVFEDVIAMKEHFQIKGMMP